MQIFQNTIHFKSVREHKKKIISMKIAFTSYTSYYMIAEFQITVAFICTHIGNHTNPHHRV